jgi:ABC-type cobalamin/Fe3+-siderophores transport system ATPase subunit
VAARAAFHDEWYTTVIPLEDKTLSPQERETLQARFTEGQAAVYDHIVADLDVHRPTLYARARTALTNHDTVVLRGASGQGKSTLAYRICFEFAPSDWRFAIDSRHLNSPSHASRVAFAIAEFKKALDVDLVIVVEAAPGDTNWVSMVDDLQRAQVGKVIVTVREED